MDAEPKPSPPSPHPGSAGAVFWAPVGFAAVLSVAYLILLAFLYANADRIQDPHWSRVVYVAGGLGGLVTTAIGWVFGREVHRGTAEVASAAAHSARGAADAAQAVAARAHYEASQAHLKAWQNSQDASSGRALAVAIRAGVALPELQSMVDTLFPIVVHSALP